MAEELEDMITVREAAKECHRATETTRRWVWEGELPAQKLGNQLFVRRADLARFGCGKSMDKASRLATHPEHQGTSGESSPAAWKEPRCSECSGPFARGSSLMPGWVCVDASLVLMLLPHDLTPEVEALWQAWLGQDVEIVAPPLFFAEVTSVLKESVSFGRITPEEGETFFSDFLKLAITSVDTPGLQSKAWAMAKAHNRPKAYDAQSILSNFGFSSWKPDRKPNSLRLKWPSVWEYLRHRLLVSRNVAMSLILSIPCAGTFRP